MLRHAWIATAAVGVVVIAALATVMGPDGDQTQQPQISFGDPILIEPPGSRAAAVAGIEAETYWWTLWAFRNNAIKPGEFTKSEGGKRIEFRAVSGTTYAISLLVPGGDTYQRIWEFGKPPDPPDPDPPPDPPRPPPLDGLAKQAYGWAIDLPGNARAQGKQYGTIFHDAGELLIKSEEKDWGAVVQKAVQDMATKARAIPLDASWQNVWGPRYAAEMDLRWDAGEFTSAASVGRAWQEIAKGLSALQAVQFSF